MYKINKVPKNIRTSTVSMSLYTSSVQEFFTTWTPDSFHGSLNKVNYNYFTEKFREFYFTKGSQDQFCLQNIQSAATEETRG